MSANLKEQQTLAEAIAINFIIKKFLELPTGIKRLIHEALHARPVETVHPAAAFALLELGTEADDKELTNFFNSQAGADLTSFIILPKNKINEAAFLADYFLSNLRLENNQYSIEPIDLSVFPKK